MRDTIAASAGLGADARDPSFLNDTTSTPVAVGGSMQNLVPAPDLIVTFGTFGPDTAGLFTVPLPDLAQPDLVGAPVTVPAGVSSCVIDLVPVIPDRGDIGR